VRVYARVRVIIENYCVSCVSAYFSASLGAVEGFKPESISPQREGGCVSPP